MRHGDRGEGAGVEVSGQRDVTLSTSNGPPLSADRQFSFTTISLCQIPTRAKSQSEITSLCGNYLSGKFSI